MKKYSPADKKLDVQIGHLVSFRCTKVRRPDDSTEFAAFFPNLPPNAMTAFSIRVYSQDMSHRHTVAQRK